MADKLMNFLRRINEKFGTLAYNILFSLLTLILISSIIAWGPVKLITIFSIMAAAMNNVALFLLIVFSLQYFQGGARLNIQKQIYEKQNIAAAIYQGFLYLGIALLISQSIM